MSAIQPLLPRQYTPALSVKTVAGDTWQLDEQSPENFTMAVFYRGLHCPVCKSYLRSLSKHQDEFSDLGVRLVAISCDSRERAEKSVQDWDVADLTVGYDLSLDSARRWGLFLSKGLEGKDEPEVFCEPGLFLIRPSGELYFSSVQTMPFARPDIGDVVGAVKFVLDKDYPARGEVVDHQSV